jgi:tetratricopeptide (TPR) repeat protein
MSAIQDEAIPFQATLQSSGSYDLPARARQSFQEGLEHLQSGDAATAVAALSRSLEYSPAFVPSHIFLGIAQALTSNIYPAIDHLEKAADLDPDSFTAHFTLAQLNFKLRIPRKGYEAAERARRCAVTVEQRRMLTSLLKEERERELNGIARPTLNKPFSWPTLVLAGSGFVAVLIAIALHMA